MLSQEEARARVARGAAHLDQVRPGWFNRIDTGTLELQSGCLCILGQLNRGFFDAEAIGLVSSSCLTAEAAAANDAITHGFSLSVRCGEIPECIGRRERQKYYMPLQDAWIEAIADRRLAKSINTPEPVSEPVGA